MSTVSPASEQSRLCPTAANPPSDFSPSARTPPIFDSSSGQWDNPWPTWHHNSRLELARCMWQSLGARPLTDVNLDQALPVVKPQWGSDDSRVYYTWLGHATVLVQLYGVNVLIDPIFSERCSPVQFMGPKRYRPVPCTIDELPPIDIVLISHNHYDHLDYSSCKQLAEKADKQRKDTGRTMRWYVGKGIEQWLVDNCGVRSEDATGLVWWQQATHPLQQPPQQHGHGPSTTATAPSSEAHSFTSVSASSSERPLIAAVPCQHFSVRSPLTDERRTLWCGFTLTHRSFTLYYSGDTAYCAAFKQIGHHSPRGVDLAILPIGAYKPWWSNSRTQRHAPHSL